MDLQTGLDSKEFLVIYTDGSCIGNPGKGGWAYIAITSDIDIYANGYSEHTTNNIMELTAVIEALTSFSDTNKIHIYSDSQYVINCAQGKWKRKKNIELWEKYDKIASGKTIKFTWVKGHNGNYYNDFVDNLARSTIK